MLPFIIHLAHKKSQQPSHPGAEGASGLPGQGMDEIMHSFAASIFPGLGQGKEKA
jgi:hypothetical protein